MRRVAAAILLILICVAAATAYVKWTAFKRSYLELQAKYSLLLQELNETKNEVNRLKEEVSLLQEEVEIKEKVNEDLQDRLKTALFALSYTPARTGVSLQGRMEDKLVQCVDVARSAASSPLVVAYSKLMNFSDGVRIGEEPFTFEYVDDDVIFEDYDFVVSPDWFLVHRIGDCDDVATAIAAVMKAKGYKVSLCAGKREGVEGKHAWVRSEIGDVDFIECVRGVCRLDVGDSKNVADVCIEV